MNQNLLFVIFLVLAISFIVQRNIYFTVIIVIVSLTYILFSAKYANPREFIEAITKSGKELFSPCSISNPQYCEQADSNWTFLPQIFRSGENKIKAESSDTVLGIETNERLSQNARIGTYQIPVSQIMSRIPVLQEFKIYLDKVVKFLQGIVTDDQFQREFLINKLQNKMTVIFYAANQVLMEPILPENNYNGLLATERDFATNFNIVSFITLDENVNRELVELQREFNDLCRKLNQFVVDNVNNINPDDYNILSGRLPNVDEPIAANSLDFDI